MEALAPPSPDSKAPVLLKLRYTHKAMIDYIIANPGARHRQLAEVFDRSDGWVSKVINSDAFQAALDERKEEIMGSELFATVRDRYNLIAAGSADLIARRIEEIDRMTQSGNVTQAHEEFLLRSAELANKALGYGASGKAVNQTNVAIVVQVPAKITSSIDWQAAYTPPTE